ncbi:MAG: pyruvate ferredoxin oxidoreductase, partial [Candidatus Pacebacteria bacterium]|nr:pyruvate ferredoxin oxidoreductase [Candidatus Paceibacterota bacterium]
IANALKGVKKLIDVEMNSTGQLEKILLANGIKVDDRILKHDGRPFAQDELKERILKIIK